MLLQRPRTKSTLFNRPSTRLVGWLCFLAALAAVPGAIATDDPYPVPGMLVSVGDHRLHIHCSGRGTPTVILDAGLGGNSLHWVYVQPRVASFTRVCSYDRAGYGWSEPGPAGRTGIRNAEELYTLLRAANVAGPYVLVGHSFAGYVARLFANRHAEETVGLVLVDAAHEAQFDRFEAAGFGVPIAPTRRSFYIGNAYAIPDGFP